MVKRIAIAAVVAFGLFVGSAQNAAAQPALAPQAPAETVNLSGPRFGVTFLNDGVRHRLADAGIDVGPAISQFGWQKEKRFLSSANGFTGVTEWVLLFGGMDQGTVLPSFSWLVGMRSIKGVEFAVGPNLSVGGIALALAGGITVRTGNLNIPLNIAAVPSKNGLRVSMLAGFNTRRR
ncbi:MAG: hypothetical protein ABI024_02215 [Vicinamibacterales bacterium]